MELFERPEVLGLLDQPVQDQSEALLGESEGILDRVSFEVEQRHQNFLELGRALFVLEPHQLFEFVQQTSAIIQRVAEIEIDKAELGGKPFAALLDIGIQGAVPDHAWLPSGVKHANNLYRLDYKLTFWNFGLGFDFANFYFCFSITSSIQDSGDPEGLLS